MRHSARSEETPARPVHQSVTDEDLYEALRGHWHPVAYVSELAEGGPLPVTLLDEPLVLARIDGAVSAFRDICVHRGTALSLGSVDESGLRCGYHGWTYNGGGRCTKIPSRPDLHIPSRARLTAFSVCPTGRKTCRCFTLMGRDYAFDDATDQEMLDFNALVIGQDLRFVESQRPEELPVDLSAELQIAGVDRVAIEYRRWLREIAKGSEAARQAGGQ